MGGGNQEKSCQSDSYGVSGDRTINKSENSQFKVNTPYTFLHVTDLEVLLGEDNIILPFSIFFFVYLTWYYNTNFQIMHHATVWLKYY
jgi:hypothetical protein